MATQRTIDWSSVVSAPPADAPRLGRQLEAVLNLMADGESRTLYQIRQALAMKELYASECSISARLRDLRKMGRTVEREKIGKGLFKYRVRN